MKTLIRNATVLTMDKEMHIYSPGYVLTVDETIITKRQQIKD